jgi:hypothetical protein
MAQVLIDKGVAILDLFTALTMPYIACQQASQDLFDDVVRLERIFLRYEPKVVSSDSCTYTGLVQDQIATQLLGQQWSESTPMVVICAHCRMALARG